MKINENKSNPSLFIKIVYSFLKMGENELAKLTCKRGVTRFPGDAKLLNVLGQIYIAHFSEKNNKEDLLKALQYFEKSLSINGNNYHTLLLVAKIYLQGRAFKKSKEKIDKIFEILPRDGKATELLQILKLKEEGQHKISAEKQKILTESINDFRGPQVSVSENNEVLIAALSIFKNLENLELILLIDKYGFEIKRVLESHLYNNNIGNILSNIMLASNNTVKKTNLGQFKKGLLLTSFGDVYLTNINNNVSLFIMASKNSNQKDINHYINKYLKLISKSK